MKRGKVANDGKDPRQGLREESNGVRRARSEGALVRYDVPLKSTAICNAAPGKGNLGVTGATLLTLKDSMHSVMRMRMSAAARQ